MTAALTACGGKNTTGPEPTVDPSKYAVTSPITIEWWHALESQYQPTLDKVIKDFETKNPNIKVKAVYQGSYTDLNEKLVAAQAAGTTLPALAIANTPYVAQYGEAGLCEVLDPYIKATGFDIKDFGAGLVTASSYDGKQVALPFQISTQIMYYNKDMADAEGIKIPEKWSDMDEFMTKAAKLNNGKTDRYATIIPAWDQWYYEPFFLNNGVNIVNKDKKSTDLNSDKALEIAGAIKKWSLDGKAYFANGKDASANMRQSFLDGKTFSVIHTTSLYDMYVKNAKFKVGMAWLPKGNTSYSEIGGNVLLIPAKNTQEVKNAAWVFLSYLTSKDVNMVWATDTGYMPTRNSVTKTDAAKDFLKAKPAFQVVFDHLNDIQPRIQHPAYSKLATVWMESFAKSVNEKQDLKALMDNAKKQIDEALSDQ
jgi:ABC-type sugar transport system, periplasmic component